VASSPAVTRDGTVYANSFYRVDALVGAAAPAQSPWPMFQANPQQTGRAGR
jgi:hypothetical protein